MERLSKEWMFKTLTALGFKETDAKVYVYLSAEGLQKAHDLAEALRLCRWQLYRSIKNLKTKGIIDTFPGRPARFSAVPFEKVLDLLISVKAEQQKALQESKEELLSTWRSITRKKSMES